MSIRQIASDKWQIDCYPHGRNGKRIRLYFEGTEEAARSVEKDLMQTGADLSGSLAVNATVADLFPSYLEWYELHRTKTTTRHQRAVTLPLI